MNTDTMNVNADLTDEGIDAAHRVLEGARCEVRATVLTPAEKARLEGERNAWLAKGEATRASALVMCASEGVKQHKRRNRASAVLERWCAYFAPDAIGWGKPSKCNGCCRNECGSYSPAHLLPDGDGSDGTCRRSHIIAGCLPAR